MNLDHREYQELFRDELIVIPPGGYHEMGRSEAIKFLSQFIPMEVDGQGLPTKPKKLKIVEDPEQHAERRGQPLKFTAPDGKLFRTQAGHDDYVETLTAEARQPTTPEVSDGPKRRRRAETGR